ncbi:MAG TPA: bifunctional transaldolase/phosoglucose isomerase [Caulobacteraceae bacterium]|nr:bifunctional transaldolase/phosoglucose isomerase [Caulobacteraceae bacterium]
MTNPLLQLGDAGQAVWLDFIERRILLNGAFRRLIDEDGLKGVTSNPSIFEKAIGESDDYDAPIGAALAKGDADAAALFDDLAIADIQAACDQLRPVYDRLAGGDGYASIEVSPYLAMDTRASIAEARRLWRAVNRPNLMIKIPGTKPGVPAIRQLIGEGINVNVTLLFGLDAYLAVAEAHLAGLEALSAGGGDVAKIGGVASFFVSRIDTQIDNRIDARLNAGDARAAELEALRGKVAIANAKIAYQRWLAMMQGPRWQAMTAAGARPQRLLWASTGTKNPAYSDVLYIEALIGPDTINTVPPKTMDAFRDRGRVAPTLGQGVDEAEAILAAAERLGLGLQDVTDRLVEDGVKQFAEAADKLYAAVARKRSTALGPKQNGQEIGLSADLEAPVEAARGRAADEGWARRLWAGDAGLWTNADEASWVGWLAAAHGQAVDVAALEAFRSEVADAGFIHAVVLGMGGSSLGPEVLAETFGSRPDHPKLIVLDSTDPEQIARVEAEIDPARTLFVVSSKSGTTLEPNILEAHFHALVERTVGANAAGGHFVAVTDPGSSLDRLAAQNGFRRVFHGDPAIGGRYSVLSNFGMAPAAAMGLDVRAFLESAAVMANACSAATPPAANPGVELGLVIGAAANAGRDKVTVILSHGLADLGAWLEQLLAESTGKLGKGVVPIAAESLGASGAYGRDRLFAYLRLDGADDPAMDEAVRALEEAGQPVVRITLADRDSLGQEFVRWEVATAIAGAVIGINPFDQPDVEAQKVKTRALTDAFEQTGAWAREQATATDDDLAVFVDDANLKALIDDGASVSLDALLGAHIKRANGGDYLALLAYVDRNHHNTEMLQKLRKRLRDHTHAATALGFGPRYLHSTGQAYKGGPNSGVFIEITHDATPDLPVPGRSFTFGLVEQAQAKGDFDVLAERGRRLIRVHLGANVEQGLKRFVDAVDRSLI